jgi:hypothetical protein
MKNRLNALWNIAPRNPTQTAYTRFLKTPEGRMRTAFTDAQDAFQAMGDNVLKTAYSDILDGGKREADND